MASRKKKLYTDEQQEIARQYFGLSEKFTKADVILKRDAACPTSGTTAIHDNLKTWGYARVLLNEEQVPHPFMRIDLWRS